MNDLILFYPSLNPSPPPLFFCVCIREEAVGELIADIFGSSDEEEEFEVSLQIIFISSTHSYYSSIALK